MTKPDDQLPEPLEELNQLIQKAEDKKELANIGAGQLEDLLGGEKGQKYLQTILDLARKDKNWRFALGCVWTNSFKNRQVAEQIEKAKDLYFPENHP